MADAEVWQEVQDKNSNKIYYFNKKTRETSWTKPANATIIPLAGTVSGASAAKPKLPPNWIETIDSTTNKPYYYNKVTKETSWSAPKEEAPKPVEAPKPAEVPVSKPVEVPVVKPAEAPAAKPAETPASSNASADAGGADGNKNRRQRTGNVSPDGEWEEVVDPSTNKKYWYNRFTKATAWNLPSSAKVTKEKDDAHPTGTIKDNTVTQIQEKKEAAASTPAPAKAKEAEKPKEKPKAKGNDSDDDDDDNNEDSDDDKEEQSKNERPSDRMMKLKQALNDKETDPKSKVGGGGGDDEEDEDGEAYEFRFAKHRHGWLNRTFRVGKAYDESQLLTFKKSLIKKALLKKNRDLDAEAIQAHKNIMSYMGDRKSSKAPIEHARKLISNALTHPAGLRDEIYLQICKQTTDNPKLDSTMKGWELMVFCLASFPPSKQLKKFLTSYFNSTKESEEVDNKVKEFAAECLNRLEKIITIGQRKEVPSAHELECMKNMKPVPIRVNLVNGTFKTLHVDAYTFARDVEAMMIEKLKLSLATPFALYEGDAGDTNVERILEAKDRVLDVLAAWEKEPEVEEAKEVEKGVDPKLKKQPSQPKLVVQGPRFNQFLYKAKLVLKTSDPDVIADPEAVSMLYLQAIHDIVTFRYPVKEKDITVLAALQLQATFGDYQPDAHGPGWLVPKLSEYMPVHLLNNNKGKKSEQLCQEWEQKILEKYSKISGFTSLEAKLNYLDYVQEWPFYGATFFTVEQRQFKDYPSPILLGITCEGVILMHPQKKTLLENYPYTDIVTWGHSDERFIVVVGNIVQQRKLIFKTKHGKLMNNLIHDYVKFKVKNKVGGMPSESSKDTAAAAE